MILLEPKDIVKTNQTQIEDKVEVTHQIIATADITIREIIKTKINFTRINRVRILVGLGIRIFRTYSTNLPDNKDNSINNNREVVFNRLANNTIEHIETSMATFGRKKYIEKNIKMKVKIMDILGKPFSRKWKKRSRECKSITKKNKKKNESNESITDINKTTKMSMILMREIKY